MNERSSRGSIASIAFISKRYHRALNRYWIESGAVRTPNDMSNVLAPLIERYFGELWNEGRVELVDELLHPEYVNHSPSPGLPPGREGVRVVVRAMRSAFPDLHYTIEDLVAGADAVATRTRLRGTHRGDFFGLAPTGRAVDVAQMTIERFRDGRIVAHHRLTDEALLARQLAGR